MRITNNMISQRVLTNLQRSFQSVATLQQVLSSGRNFRLPEDNPIGVTDALNLRQELAQNRRYSRNIDQATTDLQLTESTLGTVNERLQRARSIALQAANGTLTADARRGVVQELDQLLQTYVDLGNSNFEGRYIFSGDRTSRKPFELIGSGPTEGVRYLGDFNNRDIAIGDGQTIAANMTGAQAFFNTLNEITSSLSVTPEALLATELAGVSEPPLTGVAGDFTVNGVTVNFDPATDTLETLRDAINGANADADARIDSNGRLIIRSLTSNDVQLANGTSNVLEALDLFHRVEGGAIGAGITAATTLASLGITGDALSIVTGDQTYQVDLAAATTVGDVIAAVAGSGAPVEAFINNAGTGLVFSSTESVDSLDIDPLRKIFGSSALAPGTLTGTVTLGGLGITAGIIEIDNGGSVTQVDLTGATTIEEVLAGLNGVNGIRASINSDASSIDVESLTFTSGLTITDVGPPVGTDVATVLGFAQTRAEDNSADFAVDSPGTVDEVVSDNIFKTLIDLRNELGEETLDVDKIDQALGGFDRDLDLILSNRTDLGSKINRLEGTLDRYGSFEVFLTELLSKNEDADLTVAITELGTQSNVLEASLASGARILQPSLLDFLR